MSKISTLINMIRNNPEEIGKAIDANVSRWKIVRFIPDRLYLKMRYAFFIHKRLNLSNPVTFNEKLQWLKLHDHNPLYTTMVDKYEAKKYFTSMIGEGYTIPTLGVWDRFEDIDFSRLPDQFVIKCTHDSGGLVICRDKKTFDIEAARQKINKCLSKNYYYVCREWPYKNVKPRIIAEEYLENIDTKELRDYKIFGFNGSAKALYIATDRQKMGEQLKFDFFDSEFHPLHIKNGHPNASTLPKKPVKLDEMLRITEKLTKGFPHIRVDFYEVEGKVYFGEFTFYHMGGVTPFEPPIWDEKFGEWIDLSLAYNGKK